VLAQVCAFSDVQVAVTANSASSPVNPGDADLMGICFVTAATGRVVNSRIVVSGGYNTQGLDFGSSDADVRDSVIEISNVYDGVGTQAHGSASRMSGSTVRVLSYAGTNLLNSSCAAAILGYAGILHSEASVADCPPPNIPRLTVDGPCFGCLIDDVYQ
jgi:hypothetical protein